MLHINPQLFEAQLDAIAELLPQVTQALNAKDHTAANEIAKEIEGKCNYLVSKLEKIGLKDCVTQSQDLHSSKAKDDTDIDYLKRLNDDCRNSCANADYICNFKNRLNDILIPGLKLTNNPNLTAAEIIIADFTTIVENYLQHAEKLVAQSEIKYKELAPIQPNTIVIYNYFLTGMDPGTRKILNIDSTGHLAMRVCNAKGEEVYISFYPGEEIQNSKPTYKQRAFEIFAKVAHVPENIAKEGLFQPLSQDLFRRFIHEDEPDSKYKLAYWKNTSTVIHCDRQPGLDAEKLYTLAKQMVESKVDYRYMSNNCATPILNLLKQVDCEAVLPLPISTKAISAPGEIANYCEKLARKIASDQFSQTFPDTKTDKDRVLTALNVIEQNLQKLSADLAVQSDMSHTIKNTELIKQLITLVQACITTIEAKEDLDYSQLQTFYDNYTNLCISTEDKHYTADKLLNNIYYIGMLLPSTLLKQAISNVKSFQKNAENLLTAKLKSARDANAQANLKDLHSKIDKELKDIITALEAVPLDQNPHITLTNLTTVMMGIQKQLKVDMQTLGATNNGTSDTKVPAEIESFAKTINKDVSDCIGAINELIYFNINSTIDPYSRHNLFKRLQNLLLGDITANFSTLESLLQASEAKLKKLQKGALMSYQHTITAYIKGLDKNHYSRVIAAIDEISAKSTKKAKKLSQEIARLRIQAHMLIYFKCFMKGEMNIDALIANLNVLADNTANLALSCELNTFIVGLQTQAELNGMTLGDSQVILKHAAAYKFHYYDFKNNKDFVQQNAAAFAESIPLNANTLRRFLSVKYLLCTKLQSISKHPLLRTNIEITRGLQLAQTLLSKRFYPHIYAELTSIYQKIVSNQNQMQDPAALIFIDIYRGINCFYELQAKNTTYSQLQNGLDSLKNETFLSPYKGNDLGLKAELESFYGCVTASLNTIHYKEINTIEMLAADIKAIKDAINSVRLISLDDIIDNLQKPLSAMKEHGCSYTELQDFQCQLKELYFNIPDEARATTVKGSVEKALGHTNKLLYLNSKKSRKLLASCLGIKDYKHATIDNILNYGAGENAAEYKRELAAVVNSFANGELNEQQFYLHLAAYIDTHKPKFFLPKALHFFYDLYTPQNAEKYKAVSNLRSFKRLFARKFNAIEEQRLLLARDKSPALVPTTGSINSDEKSVAALVEISKKDFKYKIERISETIETHIFASGINEGDKYYSHAAHKARQLIATITKKLDKMPQDTYAAKLAEIKSLFTPKLNTKAGFFGLGGRNLVNVTLYKQIIDIIDESCEITLTRKP